MPKEDAPWPLWMRIIRVLVPGLVRIALWGVALALTATGVVTWRNWSALAKRGTDATARVERCKSLGKGGGYFSSCTYSYRVGLNGALNEGHFQSGRHFEEGQTIAIRYLPEEPATSAWSPDLEYPNLIPAAMTAVGVAFLVLVARGERKDRRRGRETRKAQ